MKLTWAVAAALVLFATSCAGASSGPGENQVTASPTPAAAPVAPATPEEVSTNEEENEASNAGVHATDLILEAEMTRLGAGFEVTARLAALDRRVIAAPTILVEMGPGVGVSAVPDGCVIVDTEISCSFPSVSGLTTPTDPISALFLFGALNESGPLSVTLTATSLNNPLTNDPDPTNNVVTLTFEP